MKRKTLFFGTLLVLILVAVTILTTALPAGAEVSRDRASVIKQAAGRLLYFQNTDGGFDWKADGDNTKGSASNILGITAIGILEAYKLDADPVLATALAKAYKYAVDTPPVYFWQTDRYNEITGVDSSPDVTFLVKLGQAAATNPTLLAAINAAVPDTTSQNITDLAKTRWDNRVLYLGSTTETPVAGTPAGLAEWDRNNRHSQNLDGMIPWQIELNIKAALTLSTVYPDGGYAEQAAAIAVVMDASIDNADNPFFSSIDTTQDEFIGGLTGAIEGYLEVGGYSTKADDLMAKLIYFQQPDGSWRYYDHKLAKGYAEGYTQDTAYAIMALKKQGSPEAIKAANKAAAWLVSNQYKNGGWDDTYDVDVIPPEISEVISEAAWALSQLPAPITISSGGYYSLQSIIDEAPDGAIITLPAGTYEVDSTIIVNHPVTITGPTDGEATIIGQNSNAVPVFNVTTNDVTIENLKITITKTALDGVTDILLGLIQMASNTTGTEINGNTIWVPNQGARNAMANWKVFGIRFLSNCTGTVTGNTIYDTRQGISCGYTGNGSDVTIQNNNIYNTKGGICIYTNQADYDNGYYTITGNTWNGPDAASSHNEWDITWHSATYNVDYQQTIVALSAANNGAYVIDRRATVTPVTGNRSHVFVDAASTNATAEGNINFPCPSIASAINYVVPGGKVIVAAGTYTESPNINKSLTLQGASAASTTITGAGTHTITISANNVEITRFTITNPTPLPGPDSTTSGIYLDGRSNINIHNNVITNVGDGVTDFSRTFGIGIVASTVDTNNITIAYNTISSIHSGKGNASPKRTASADGIAVGWSNSNQTITGLEIYSNNITDIKAFYGEAWPVGSGANGIMINVGGGSSATGTVVNAKIHDNIIDGLEGFWAHGIGLEGNTPGAVVQDNTIKNLISHKTDWDDAVAVNVEDNDFASTVTVNRNHFSNVIYGVNHSTSVGIVNASGNWWNKDTGNDVRGMIRGGNIVYAPWYGSDDALHSDRSIHNINKNTDHDTIQEAINFATAGNTITVAAGGTYTEEVTINKSGLTLLGDPGATNKKGAATNAPAIVGPVKITASNVKVSGFDISNPTGYYGVSVGFANTFRADGAELSYNTIHSVNGTASGDGIRVVIVEPSSDVTVKYNIIENSGPTNSVAESWTDTVAGIFLRTQDAIVDEVFSNITIEDNIITNITQLHARSGKGVNGIWVGGSTGTYTISEINVINNQITNISSNLASHGFFINHGNSGGGTTTELKVNNNNISNISSTGSFARGIGLEAKMPSAEVKGNTISLITSTVEATGVRLENNPDVSTITFSGNTYGDRAMSIANSTVSVNATAFSTLTPIVNTFQEVLYNGTYNYFGLNAFSTIQSGINGVAIGGTVNVAEGTYDETVDITKRIILQGAGSSDSGTVLINSGAQTDFTKLPNVMGVTYGTGYRPNVIISASGIDVNNPVLLKDLQIKPGPNIGYPRPAIFLRPGTAGAGYEASYSYLEINNVHIIGDTSGDTPGQAGPPQINPVSTNAWGLTIDGSTSMHHLVVKDCNFSTLTYGMIFYNNATKPSVADDIKISNTTFTGNSVKGFYAEKLSNAAFTDVKVTNNGDIAHAPYYWAKDNSGLDINLKFGTYSNITLNNLTVTGNGIGSSNGTGLAIKARGTGHDTGSNGDYAAHPATLENVNIIGGTFTGNPDDIRIGEPLMANESPTIVSIHNATITNTNQSIGMISYLSGVTINAVDNYWGSVNGPTNTSNTYNITDRGSSANGTISYAPWLKVAGDLTSSFAPVTIGTTGYYASIQAAVTAADPGSTINVKAGTYTESKITISNGLTLKGAGSASTIIDGGNAVLASSGALYISHVTAPVTIDGFTFKNAGTYLPGDPDQVTANIVVPSSTTSGSVTIRNCHFIGRNDGSLSDMGIWSYSTDGNLILQNNEFEKMWQGVLLELPRGGATVQNNTFHNLLPTTTGTEPMGVFAFTYSGENVVAPLVINNNTFRDFNGSGISIGGGYTGDNGVGQFSNVQITNNTISGIGSGTERRHVGIILINYGTTLTEAANDGIINATISGNTITGTDITGDSKGIWLNGPNNNVSILRNTITGVNKGIASDERNAGAGFSTGTVAHFNLLNGNAIAVSNGSTDSANIIDATNNWWGTTNGDAILLKVNGSVSYNPWHLKQLSGLGTETSQKTQNSVVLVWTTEGAWEGNYFDFRYSTKEIKTTADWNNAKKVTDEPAPVNGQQQKMAVRGLTAGTTYYFAFVLVDGNNKSDIGQLTNVKTLAATDTVTDNIAPADITGFTASPGSPSTTSINLQWKATGDDGTVGFASKYIIKRSTNLAFSDAVIIYNNLTPKAYNQTENLTITKLSPNTTYYFAIQAVDDVNKASTFVNASLKTAADLPTVTGINPLNGDNSEARPLTITGTNFITTGTTTVKLVSGATVITLTDVAVTGTTGLTAQIPAGVPTGTYKARVTNANGTSAPGGTYKVERAEQPVPAVINVIPNLATNNTIINNVKILGENFAAGATVTINGVPATNVVFNNANSLTVTMPALAAGEYDVIVTVGAKNNTVSTVKYIVTAPVTLTDEEITTSGIVETTGNITAGLTLTTDDSEDATKNTDDDVQISVVIPPDTKVEDINGNAYTGTINPPRVVKPDTTVQTGLSPDAIVIEMGSANQTINFSQPFVAVVTVTGTSQPTIFYYNKKSGEYDLAGMNGTKDGVTYIEGGKLLGKDNNTYTIGLLLDHMSVYVASVSSLLPAPTPTTTPGDQIGGGSVGGGGVPSTGTTNIRGLVSSTGRFNEMVLATTADGVCSLTIPTGTIGLDKDLQPITQIKMIAINTPPALPENTYIIGAAYDFGPSGSSFNPGITLTWKYNPNDLPANISETDLTLAYYDTETGEWVLLDSKVDIAKHTLTAKITHFSTFAIIGVAKAAEFSIGPISVSPAVITAGEAFAVSTTVANTGDKDGSYLVVLKIDGINYAEKSVTVAAGSNQNVSFDVVKETAGTYSFEINGVTGSFNVVSKPSIEPTPTVQPETTPSTPEMTPTTPPASTPASTQPVEPVKGTNWFLTWGLVAIALVIAVTLVVLYIRRHRD